MLGLDSTVTAGILAIVGTIVGALVGSFLGLRRHRKETNWALRQKAYVDLVLSLQQMRDYYGLVFDDSVGLTSHSEQFLQKRAVVFESAREVFQRSRALAFVLLGVDISEALDQLERTIQSEIHGSVGEWADECFGAVDEALILVSKRAAQELAA